MKIEIWSDIMCPFCYIGKKRFDDALAQFEHKDEVEIEWKSFMLSPDLKTDPSKNNNQFLAEHKGISLEEATGMNNYVTDMAAQAGLTYDFNKAIVANSFNAHRFSHFAKQYGKQNEAEEKLFAAYFTEGKNIDDAETLMAMAAELELDVTKLANVMGSGAYAKDVMADIDEAQELGIRGVPFFVLNRKYAISGAQETAVFLDTLQKAFAEEAK
ncbi:DsbA family oxidoreductase [Flavobacterium cerinum]|uniref:DsbA family oxidoreductase n=1 Tax=Flavobacterium cerinum TaxID=2502784 RepID=A0A3S3SE28_9FLAO|nr:DsbA family oxidoreductase [Flavobacterium cerinum]RWW99684.1 DsbA family oxidoreductase [Flavobacterium cerinum]